MNEEIELIAEYFNHYADKMGIDEFFEQVEKGIIVIEKEERKSLCYELWEKEQHVPIKTQQEGDTLDIDISLGIDSILEEINKHSVNHVIIHTENKNYEGLEKLKDLDKDVKIVYSSIVLKMQEPITVDEFLAMREFINSIVQSIKEQQLTPVEEILALYDMIKWYQYNLDEENSDNARNIHSFVSTGQIICVGYSVLFAQIAKELGHNAFVVAINSNNYNEENAVGHVRNAIYIDDDHYDIHGLYYLDATFDSTANDKIGEKYGQDVQEFNLFYQCFLFTKDQYQYLFANERKPVSITDIYQILPYVQDDFKDFNEEELLREPKKISLETIKRIYKNVMLKLKRNKEQLDEMMEDFDRHNQVQQEILDKNGGDLRGYRN